MATPDLTASEVMAGAAALMNDSNRTVYTDAALLPYLRIAMDELQEHYQINSIPVTEDVSAVIQVDAGETVIVFNGVGVPSLPDDLVEPLELWERARSTDPFVPMTKKDFLPHYLEGSPTSQFMFWAWQDNEIRLPEATQNNDVKLDYVKQLFFPVVDENTSINVINAKTFLEYRAAALAAEFVERNITSANALNAYAVLAIDRATGIGIKGKQSINTRRRPFRASYKRRNTSW